MEEDGGTPSSQHRKCNTVPSATPYHQGVVLLQDSDRILQSRDRLDVVLVLLVEP